MVPLCGSATPGGCNRSCATRWSDQPNRMARTRATAPCAGTTQQTNPLPASEDANGVFHAFTSLKVAALEMKTSKQRLRSGWIRIFCSSACASRPECRPSLAQRCRIIFMALPFEFLLRFPETRHACRAFRARSRASRSSCSVIAHPGLGPIRALRSIRVPTRLAGANGA